MRDLKGYMDFVGVSKKKYVDEWIDLNLIPGAVRDIEKVLIRSLILLAVHTEVAP